MVGGHYRQGWGVCVCVCVLFFVFVFFKNTVSAQQIFKSRMNDQAGIWTIAWEIVCTLFLKLTVMYMYRYASPVNGTYNLASLPKDCILSWFVYTTLNVQFRE